MEWYKHSTGSHDDPDISDAWDELGDFGYVGFFIILEIYGQEYSHRNSEDFITISHTFLRRKLRKSWEKVQLLLNFFQKRNRIISKNDGSDIMIKVPKFIALASNWTRRPPTEEPTEEPTAKEEKKNRRRIRKEKDTEENKENKEKKLYGDFVFFTDDEYKKLVDKFGETGVTKRIENLNNYAHKIGARKFKAKYSSHYHVLLSWEEKNNTTPQSSGMSAMDKQLLKIEEAKREQGIVK